MRHLPLQPYSLNPSDLKEMLVDEEGPKLEFKREYDFSKSQGLEERRGEFAKDIMALANTAGRSSDDFAYLVIGAEDKKNPDGTRPAKSVKPGEYNQDALERCVNGFCRPKLHLLYREIDVEGTLYGVIIVPPSPHPHYLSKDISSGPPTKRKTYLENTTFIRIGQNVSIAPPPEIALMEKQKESWAAPKPTKYVTKIRILSSDRGDTVRLSVSEKISRTNFVEKYWGKVSWHLSVRDGYDVAGNRVRLLSPNRELEEYTKKYSEYLLELWDWADGYGWPAELNLTAANIGNAPASNIRIDLLFPHELPLVDLSNAKKLPLPPAPPPQLSIPELPSVLGYYIPQSLWGAPSAIAGEKPLIFDESIAELRVDRIPRSGKWPLRGLLVRTIPLPSRKSNKKVPYRINMRNGSIEPLLAATAAIDNPAEENLEIEVTISFDDTVVNEVIKVKKEVVKDIDKGETRNSARQASTAAAIAAALPGLREHLEKREAEKPDLLKAQREAEDRAEQEAINFQKWRRNE